MVYFDSAIRLSMIKAIVESYEELEEDCAKIERIKVVLTINEEQKA